MSVSAECPQPRAVRRARTRLGHHDCTASGTRHYRALNASRTRPESEPPSGVTFSTSTNARREPRFSMCMSCFKSRDSRAQDVALRPKRVRV
eukprot:1892158-Rhodomonas_salina.1